MPLLEGATVGTRIGMLTVLVTVVMIRTLLLLLLLLGKTVMVMKEGVMDGEVVWSEWRSHRGGQQGSGKVRCCGQWKGSIDG